MLLTEGNEPDLRAVFHAAGGCVTLCVVTENALPKFVAEADAGVAWAGVVIQATSQVLEKIGSRPRHQPLHCWLCDAPTLCRSEPPRAIVIMLPFGIDAPTVVAGLGFCRECCDQYDEAELGQAAVARLRELWLPDLRVLPPMSAAGNA